MALSLIKSLKIPAKIKFPNDIVVLGENSSEFHKLSGILVDSKSSGSKLKEVYIGVGLNVKRQDFPSNVLGISLEEILGSELNLEEVFNLILPDLSATLNEFFNNGFSSSEKEIESYKWQT